jgi:lipid A 3-O-deacylase
MRVRVLFGTTSMVMFATLLASTPASAQWFKDARTFSLYEENDAITSTGDESYTQGVRLTWDFSQWPEWSTRLERFSPLRRVVNFLRRKEMKQVLTACQPQADRAFDPCGTVSFGLGQLQYSPADIKTKELVPRDRPYAGALFGTIGLNVRDGPVQASTEAMIGVLGPLSHSQSFQSLAHWTWSNGAEQPQGWHHQLRNAVILGVVTNVGYRLFEYCKAGPCTGVYEEKRRFDLTVRGEGVATTVMTRASGGLTARLGSRFPDNVLGQRIPATGRSMETRGRSWWWVVFGTADGRAVGHNAYLEGSYADRGPDDWRSRREIELRDFINEWSLGFGIGNRAGSFGFQGVSRTEEYDPIDGARPLIGRHIYGAVTFAINVMPR